MSRITVTGFRWALEKAGLPYEVSLIDFGDLDSPAYRRKQPVEMVPAFEANGRDYLLDRFTAADILMATVLRLIRHTDLVASFPPWSAPISSAVRRGRPSRRPCAIRWPATRATRPSPPEFILGEGRVRAVLRIPRRAHRAGAGSAQKKSTT